MINEKFAARFSELQNELSLVRFTSSEYDASHAEPGVWRKWTTSAENLIRASCGERSPYYANFRKVNETCGGYESPFMELAGIFQSAKEAFDGGYLFDIERDVTAEIFGDFVVLAKRALDENNKDVAAVLASAALEDALKRHAKLNSLNVDDATMSNVISALKSKGLVSGAQKSMLAAMLQTRNLAMHAKWEKLEKPDVSGLIGFVEQFLLTNFSRGE